MKTSKNKVEFNKLDPNSEGKVKYFMQITSEPDEKPIGLTQEEFDKVVAIGEDVVKASKDKAKLEEFATIEPIKGSAFFYKNQRIKAKKIEKLFSKGFEKIIKNALDLHERGLTAKTETTVPNNTADDLLVTHIQKQLLKSWFPDGHPFEHNESLKEDFENWEIAALEDAKVALKAMQEYRSETS